MAQMHGKHEPHQVPSYESVRKILDWSNAQVVTYALVVLMLAACDPKTTQVITKPTLVDGGEKLVLQTVPEELLVEHPIAEGPLSMCPDVAAARKRELLACNADKRSMRGITTPVATKDDR